jgi:hypothetical protein
MGSDISEILIKEIISYNPGIKTVIGSYEELNLGRVKI